MVRTAPRYWGHDPANLPPRAPYRSPPRGVVTSVEYLARWTRISTPIESASGDAKPNETPGRLATSSSDMAWSFIDLIEGVDDRHAVGLCYKRLHPLPGEQLTVAVLCMPSIAPNSRLPSRVSDPTARTG